MKTSEENGIITMTSDNGKYYCQMSKEYCQDMKEMWGIDVNVFVDKNFKLFKEFDSKEGKYVFDICKTLTDDTACFTFCLSYDKESNERKPEVLNG